MTDEDLLIRDKYGGDASAPGVAADLARLASGEPLAYVIGWVPFLGLRIYLDSRPLIPRPETEWWTELLIEHLKERFETEPFTFLDLCAGSGAIGLAVLHALPNAQVFFGELTPELAPLIEKNIRENGLDNARGDVRVSDLFSSFFDMKFDFIASNPPYIPAERLLDASVTDFEPLAALFSDADGLGIIRRIAAESPAHLLPGGALWVECDTDNIEEAAELFEAVPEAPWSDVALCTDLYGRPRLLVAE